MSRPTPFGQPILDLTRAQLPFVGLASAIALAALGAGAIHLPILFTFAALIIASALCASVACGSTADKSRQHVSLRASGAVGVYLALAIFCLVQALPMPLSWVEAISPRSADVWARALRPFGDNPITLASLSMAPGRSIVEALKFASYGLVFAVAAYLGQDRAGLRRICQIIFGTALVVALVTAGHQVLGAQELYGRYRPLDAYSIAPLLNANNRAGFLNLGFFCGLGLLLRSGRRPSVALYGLGLACIAAEVLLCESVGGSLCLGLGVLAALLLPGDSKSETAEVGRWLRAFIVLGIGVSAITMALAARTSNLGLDDHSTEKVDLFARAWRVALDHFWVGIGRGAFASVFGAYQGSGAFGYEHAENFVLQAVSEWGVPITIAAFVALGWALWPAVGGARGSPTRRCALIGCGVLLLQNLVDLGLEVPAVAASLAAVLGGMRRTTRWRTRGLSTRSLLGMGSAVTALCLLFALVWGTDSTARMRHQLQADLASVRGAPPPDFWIRLRAATLEYPAEPYFPLLGSAAALAADRDALPWISRALERGPANAAVYIQLGRILQARGAVAQALGALREAVALDPRGTLTVLDLGTRWGLSLLELAEVAPDGATGASLLIKLASQTEDVPTRLDLLARAIERDPNRVDTHQRLALVLIRDLERKNLGVVCAESREPCLARVERHLRLGNDRTTAESGKLEARLLEQRGLSREAEERLAQACDEFPLDTDCRTALVVRALGNRSPNLDRFVKALVAVSCGNRQRCGQTHLTLGDLFANHGQWQTALSHYRHAGQETPSAEVWQALARAADRLGQETLALEARRNLGLTRAADAPASNAASPEVLVPTALPPFLGE